MLPKGAKGVWNQLSFKKIFCQPPPPPSLEFLMMFQGDKLVISRNKNSWQKIVKLLNCNSWKNSWFYNLPRPESVLEESQTFDTLYPVSIRLMRVWLKKELGKLILNSLTLKIHCKINCLLEAFELEMHSDTKVKNKKKWNLFLYMYFDNEKTFKYIIFCPKISVQNWIKSREVCKAKCWKNCVCSLCTLE